MTASIGHIRAGKLRPLAVTTIKRSDALPDTPCVGDFVYGYEASSWFGFGAPKSTPADVIDTLMHEINAGLAGATPSRRSSPTWAACCSPARRPTTVTT